ncbi:hypothetical protein J6590_036262 [Homalodisca vitripennis]|nr:hypothetical protein J6590_036262 [Homalodisca vitripennis]
MTPIQSDALPSGGNVIVEFRTATSLTQTVTTVNDSFGGPEILLSLIYNPPRSRVDQFLPDHPVILADDFISKHVDWSSNPKTPHGSSVAAPATSTHFPKNPFHNSVRSVPDIFPLYRYPV